MRFGICHSIANIAIFVQYFLSQIVILIIFYLRSKAGLMVRLFKEAGKAVTAMPQLVFQPFWVSKGIGACPPSIVCLACMFVSKKCSVNTSSLFQTYLALVAACAVWGIGILLLVNAGQSEAHPITGLMAFVEDSDLSYAKYCFVFGIIWAVNFVSACQHFVIAGAVETWYFAR